MMLPKPEDFMARLQVVMMHGIGSSLPLPKLPRRRERIVRRDYIDQIP